MSRQENSPPKSPSTSGVVGLDEACRFRLLEMEADERAIATRRDILQKRLVETIPGLVVNGDQAHRLAGNLHISVLGVPNSAIVARSRHKLALSTGSACSSGVEAPSHVLQGINLPDELVEGALRIGISKFTTDDEVTLAAELLGSAFAQTQKLLHSKL